VPKFNREGKIKPCLGFVLSVDRGNHDLGGNNDTPSSAFHQRRKKEPSNMKFEVEKNNGMGKEKLVFRSRREPNRAFTIGIIAMMILGLLFGFTYWDSDLAINRPLSTIRKESFLGQVVQSEDTKELVPLEAHIMSKCPDAKDCLKLLVLPTMQKVIDKVNFTLSYIGTYATPDLENISSIF
jgi:hypothetical protein